MSQQLLVRQEVGWRLSIWAVNKEEVFFHCLRQPRRHQGWWCVLSEAADGVAASSSTTGGTPAATQCRTWRGGSVFWGEGWLWWLQIELVIRLCPWEVILSVRALWWLPGWKCFAQSSCPHAQSRCRQHARDHSFKMPQALYFSAGRDTEILFLPRPSFPSTKMAHISSSETLATFLSLQWEFYLKRNQAFWTTVLFWWVIYHHRPPRVVIT